MSSPLAAPAPDPLFEPLTIGDLELPSRLVMAPMSRNRSVGALPHRSAATYYAQRAGAGLIVSEGLAISAEGAGQFDIPGLWSEEQVAAWQPIVSAVHEAGGRIFAQLWHLGRAGLTEHLPGGRRPVGPSAVAIDPTTYVARRAQPYVEPVALSVADIGEVAATYAAAARNARAAGFDGVELHGANGYLIDQFLHASSNRREDEYGGSFTNRARFLVEMTQAVCEVWGPGRVGVRLSPSSSFQDMHDPDPSGLFTTALGLLDDLPLAYVHLVGPGISGAMSTAGAQVRSKLPEGAHPLDARWARSRTTHRLIATGDYTAELARAALADGAADAIGFARLYLANPDLEARFRTGAPLNEPDRDTFYGGGDEGYIDYPALA